MNVSSAAVAIETVAAHGSADLMAATENLDAVELAVMTEIAVVAWHVVVTYDFVVTALTAVIAGFVETA